MEEKDCLDKKDIELVQLSLENQDYFLCIVKKYEIPLMRYIRRITNINFEDAEDQLMPEMIKKVNWKKMKNKMEVEVKKIDLRTLYNKK